MATIVEALQSLSARVDALSTKVDARDDRAPSEAAVGALRDALAARHDQLESLEQAVRARAVLVDGLVSRIAALEEVLKAQRGTIASLARQLESAQAALGDVDRLEAAAPVAQRSGPIERTAWQSDEDTLRADAPLAVEA